MAQIHFLFSAHLDSYKFNPYKPDGLRFVDVQTGLVVEIRGEGSGDEPWDGFGDLRVHAKLSLCATKDQICFVETLINDRIVMPNVTPVSLPYVLKSRGEVVNSHGQIAKGYFPTSEFLPRDLDELLISTGDELKKHADRFVKLLRWLSNANGKAEFQDDRDPRFDLFWKTTQEEYQHVPLPKQDPINLGALVGLQWTERSQQTFAELWPTNYEEPLGHQLLREAKGIAESNPRSSLLICYSALEVGTKQHIGASVPEALWLAQNSPSPPLLKILREYLPRLHKGKLSFENWKNVRPILNRTLIDFTEDRNRLAHRGEEIEGSLSDYLRLTEDLLYAFDVVEGHSWAVNRVSKEFADKLGWRQTDFNRVGAITLRLEQ